MSPLDDNTSISLCNVKSGRMWSPMEQRHGVNFVQMAARLAIAQ